MVYCAALKRSSVLDVENFKYFLRLVTFVDISFV